MAVKTPDVPEPITDLLKGISINDIETLKMAAEEDQDRHAPPLSFEAFAHIPTRVEHIDAVKIASSKIPGAGRGIIILRGAEAGDILFKIANPLFTSVEDGEAALRDTCDNCFASKHSESGITSVLSPGSSSPPSKLTFLHCTRCKIYRYCDEKCQSEAWKKHHKYECKTLKKMGKWEGGGGEKLVHMARIRLMVRLIELQLQNKIPGSEWKEIRSLSMNKTLKKQDKEFYDGAKLIAKGLRHFTVTDLSEAEIVNVLFAIQNNELGVSHLLLRPSGKGYNPEWPSSIRVGTAVDPFVSMINHSCQPNVTWNFERRELRVVASKNLAAGDELYFSYIEDLGDFHGRRRLLQNRWGINCVCPLCEEGPKGVSAEGPGKPFGDRILRLREAGWPDSPEKFHEVKRALEAFEDAGYGPDTYPMRWFYRCLWAAETLKGESGLEEALKLCLKLFYLVEPRQNPPISADERLDTLYHLINHLISLPKNTIPGINVSVIVSHLQHERFRGLRKAFGAGSALVVFDDQGPPFGEPEDFDANLKLLLNWAGLGSIRMKDLVGL